MNVKTSEIEEKFIDILSPVLKINGGLARKITTFDKYIYDKEKLQPSVLISFKEAIYSNYAPPLYNREILIEIIFSSKNLISGERRRSDAYNLLDEARSILLDKSLFENGAPLKIISEKILNRDQNIISLSAIYSLILREESL